MSMTDDYPTIREALRVPCPTHRIPDCSPLLNGCSWPSTLNQQYDAVVREVDAILNRIHGETGT
jgi:hypothetical protein